MIGVSWFPIALAMTRVRFSADAEVWPDPGDWAALVEVEDTVASLATMEGASQEIDLWKRQPAVEKVWQFTYKAYDYRTTEQAAAVKSMMKKVVPGLSVTFQQVFDEFHRGGCPVWLIGGTVRDLMAGSKPNDVDTAILCDTRVVKRICTRQGWMHSPPDHVEMPYFNVGIAHGEDEEYLEGFSIDLVMKDPFTPETTVNMLFWSMRYGFVLDPSNYGIKDAQNKVLRPAAPPKERVQEPNTWSTWRQWVLGSFSGPTHMRHNRYLKMRMRGWEAAEDGLTESQPGCFKFFMGNQLATLLPLEVRKPEEVIDPRTMMTRHGDPQPMVPGATLFFLQEKLPKMDAAGKAAYVGKFLTALLEDLDEYYGHPKEWYDVCTRGGLVAKESHHAAQRSLDLIRDTLVATCVAPTPVFIMMANPGTFAPPGEKPEATDFAGACKHLLEAFNTLTGEAHVPSRFSVADMRRGVGGGHHHEPRQPIAQPPVAPLLMPYLADSWGRQRVPRRPAVMDPPPLVHLAPIPAGFVPQPPMFHHAPVFQHGNLPVGRVRVHVPHIGGGIGLGGMPGQFFVRHA